MKKVYFRLIAWLGLLTVIGPGTSITNDYDMLFLVGGLFFMSIGVIGMLTSGRVDPTF